MPTPSAITPFTSVITASSVGEFGLTTSRLHAASVALAAMTTPRRRIWFCFMVASASESKVDTEHERACERRIGEIDTLCDGVRREQIQLRIQPAVIRPGVEITA